MDWLSIFRVVGYGALIFGAICTVAVDYLKGKEDKKKDTQQQLLMNGLVTDVKDSKKLLEPFKDLATKLYPNIDQKEALEKLRSRMDTVDRQIQEGEQKIGGLSSQLLIEKNTIKSFDVTVAIEFSGTWNKQPYPNWLQPAKPMPFLRWRDNSKRQPDLEFCASRINYETINDTTGLFKNALVILPGGNPLGELTDMLNAYDQMDFWILFTMPENLLNPIVTIRKVDIVFSINGVKKGELHSTSPFSQDYTEALQGLIPGKAMNLSPTMSLTGKLVSILNFKL
jgi:hypothetical protein